jgi:hypothetical protein
METGQHWINVAYNVRLFMFMFPSTAASTFVLSSYGAYNDRDVCLPLQLLNKFAVFHEAISVLPLDSNPPP